MAVAMTERERWIVYPLLFFALGAALRDKFLQHVTTKDLESQRITCKELRVLDPDNPDRIVAKLTSSELAGVTPQPPEPFGVLLLIDSQGKEFCGVTNEALQVRQINCEGVRVIDPDNPQQTLAGLGSLALEPREPGGRPQRFGVLALNNREWGRVVGVPPTATAVADPSSQGEGDGEDDSQ
jgi:hypothetical protein